MDKIIFIAGPVRGDGSLEAKRNNIERAKKIIVSLIENNIPYYSPHLNIDQEILLMGEDASKFAWDCNAKFLKRCDALGVLPGWENSNGTLQEIENAKSRNLPIFYLEKSEAIQEIKNWLES